MKTITLGNPASQEEDVRENSKTIRLQHLSSNSRSQPKEVKTLREARILPDGAQPIMSETTSESKNIIDEKVDDVFINTHYYIPYILWGTLFVREIHEVTNNHTGLHTIQCIDEKGMGGRVHETFCPDGDKVEHFEANVLTAQTKDDDLTPPVQTELNGKPALIFRRLHSNWNENIYLAYSGDQKTIAKLLQRYESGAKTRQAWAWVRGAVGELPKESEKGLFARLLQSLKKRN